MSKIPKTTQIKTKPKLTDTESDTKKASTSSTSKVKTTTARKTNLLTKTAATTKKTNDDKTTSTKTVKPKPQVSTDRPQRTISQAGAPIKAGATKNTNVKTTVPVKKVATTSKTVDKNQPLRAKHSAAIVEAVRKNASKANKSIVVNTNKPNAVLDTMHNVTVSSPPSRRREIPVEIMPPKERKALPTENPNKTLIRRGSRTLEPDEVIILRRESAKRRLEEQIQTEQQHPQKPMVREPVSFEVIFPEDTANKRERSRSRARSDKTNDDDQNNYSDDFESYESDFETGSSSQNATPSDSDEAVETSEQEDSSNEAATDEENSRNKDINITVASEVDDESEFTQFPITVIQCDKERERKLDSGNYEMNSRKHTKFSEMSTLSSQQQCDSLDTFSAATSEQLDSGISNYENSNATIEVDKNKMAVSYGGYANFHTKPIITNRGRDLMSKIQFDTLTFTLYDAKPTSYDVYMRTFGQLNSTQGSTQTQEHRMAREAQTDDCDMRTVWTQHPPQYDIQTIQKLSNGLNGGFMFQNCCGELEEPYNTQKFDTQDTYETSLQAMNAFRQNDNKRSFQQQMKQLHRPLDIQKLQTFLLNSSLLISKILNDSNTHTSHLLPATKDASFSTGYFKLNSSFLNVLRVVRVFANSHYNLIVTVHESLPDADVYRSDFSNLLMVWSISDSSKPLRLLSTWSEVCRAEFCNECADILVCGLRDGSVAMWDLQETYSYCSKLDGSLTHFAATQSIVPCWGKEEALVDLGAVVDVKSFRLPATGISLGNNIGNYKSIQFTSLNDSGILTVWTLVDTAANRYDLSTTTQSAGKHQARHGNGSKYEYSSPWARVKLIQSAICDLRAYIENGSMKAPTQFEKTRSLFQRNIYNDEALQELGATQELSRSGMGLRFTSIDAGCERIYVCTNRNFVLSCSKSLKPERFHKIAIHDNRYLFPTALCVLTNEDFLAVGLSNGSVMILNCNQEKQMLNAILPNENSTTTAQPSTPRIPPNELEIGKSCAIQNIILNERRTFESDNTVQFAESSYASRPNTAACIALITNQKRPFELRVYDQQLVLSGSVLRKHLVQSLALSSDGWRLFALSNGEVRTYDFYLDQELQQSAQDSSLHKVLDIAVARTTNSEQHLLLLNTHNEVEVHLLKQ